MKTRFLFLFLIVSFCGRAQSPLSIEEAVSIALQNNYDVLLSGNEAKIDKTNNTAGNAGMLPDVVVNGSGNYALKNSHQELQSGSIADYSSLGTTTLNTGVELSWTVFDGGKMFVTRKKLNEIETLGELQFKEQVLQTVYDVTAAYYNIVKQKQQLKSINQTIEYNQERVKIMQTAFNSGSSDKTDLLQAKIDLNVYLENAINQQAAIDDAKRVLNLVLGKEADWGFDVPDSISNNYTPNKDQLNKNLYTSNTTILSLKKQADVNQLMLREAQKAGFPKINLNAGYNYANTLNTDGSVLKNRYFGPQLGVSLSLPVFMSGDIRRQEAIAKIELNSAEHRLARVKLQMNTQLQNALNQFENQQELLKIETENSGLTKENLEISLARLRLGQTTSLEVHQAQEEYVQSFTRLINFQYNLKLAETRLKQLLSNL